MAKNTPVAQDDPIETAPTLEERMDRIEAEARKHGWTLAPIIPES